MTRRNYYGRTRLAGDGKKSIWKKFFGKKTRPKRKGKGFPLKGFVRLAMKGAPAASVIWLLFFGVYFLVDETRQSGLFRVQEVRASGLKNFGEQEMLSRVAPSLGKSLVSLDLGIMEEKILGDSWVKTVSLHKAYPDRLFVRVEERLPAAVVSDPLETVVVDPEGKILEGWSGSDQVPVDWKDLPVVLGIRVESLRKAEPAALDTFRSVYTILVGAPFFGEPRLTVAVDTSGEVRVQRKEYWLRFGAGGVSEKWDRFMRMEGRLEDLKRPIREVDLRFPGKVIIR